MIIGTFKYDKKADTYAGGINTLSVVRGDVQIVPNKKSGEKEPDYRVCLMGGAELGAAWKKTSREGQDFLSVSIDDPALSGSLNAALFTAEGGDRGTPRR